MQFMQVCYHGDKAWHSMAWHDKENMKIGVVNHGMSLDLCGCNFTEAVPWWTWWSHHILNKVIAMRTLLPARLA